VPIAYRDDPPVSAEVVIVGGGIVGAATAFHAARAGLRPLVLERRPALSTLTTAAATGGFRLQLDDDEEVALVRESVDLFRHFADATGQREHDPAVREAGYLWLTTSEATAAAQRETVERQRGWGLDDVDLVTGEDVRLSWPFVAPEVVQARFRQADGLLDPIQAALGLAAGASALGAAFAPGVEVTGFRLVGDRVDAVETSRGVVRTAAAVIAAGPFSGALAARAGARLPLATIRRQKVVVPQAPEVPADAPMVIDEDTGAHWRPALGGAFVLGPDPGERPSPPTDPVPTDPALAFRLLDPRNDASVARVAPFWNDVWERSPQFFMAAGHYTMTPDHRPLLGPAGIEGLWVNTGYSGRGVMGGPAGSRHLADVLTGRIPPSDNAYRPDRPMPDRRRTEAL